MELDNLIETVASYSDSAEIRPVLTTAFQIASEAHNGFQRINGDPFISHPFAVAAMLAEWHAPLHIVAVSLLHDISNLIYSNGYVKSDIHARLGSEIFHLLEAVIDLNSAIRELENYFDAGMDTINIQHYIASVLQHDQNLVVLKIADRLHNLQTISALERFFQDRVARIGFNVLAPLADRLGMGAAKIQLENYCFEVSNPTPYGILKQYSADADFHQILETVLSELQQIFGTLTLKVEIRWQPVSLYRLYYHQIEKNARLGKPLRVEFSPLRIVDAGSFIITTDDEIDCYRLLGILHKHFPPVERQFRDFISQPKENSYRSLHTQVKHSAGHLLRVLIRTHMMDLVAERGITARWWNVPEEFLPSLPKEARLVEEKIRVYTPIGKIIDLPEGATVLDFAYSIHSDVGHCCAGALVNGKQEDRYKMLQNGDRVEIISGTPDTSPTLEWLNSVRTSYAINSIRQWLAQHQRNTMIDRGRTFLEKELNSEGLSLNNVYLRELLLILANKEGLENIEDLLVSIGVGRHKVSKLVEQLKFTRKSLRRQFTGLSNSEDVYFSVNVLSSEEAFLSLTLAHCCRPSPPDDIVGQRNDTELVVHKRTCTLVKKLEKLLPVKWDAVPAEPDFVVVVEALNRPGLASDLSTLMALSGIDIASFSTYKRSDGVMAEAHIHLNRATSLQRARIQKDLEDMSYVTRVEVIPSSFFSTPPQQQVTSNQVYQPNPYGPTVAAGTRFYGRKTECQRISTLLHDSSQNTTILIWGQKRIGKTSLMFYLQKQLQGDFLPIYIDVQGLTDSSTSQFLHQLMIQISIALQKKGGEVAQEISVPAFNKLRKNPLSHFDTFIALVQQVAVTRPLVVILDEFQCLCSLREEVISREAIFSRLRSYSQHGRNVRFILSGGGLSHQLAEHCNMTSLFNIAHDEKLGCLETQDAYKLVKDGLTKVGNITSHAIQLLLDLTASHPFYLQLLCYALHEQALEEKILITADSVSQCARKWLDREDGSRFQHLWEGKNAADSNKNKSILSTIAKSTIYQHEVNYKDLADTLSPMLTEQDLVQTLNDLAILGIVEQHYSNYRIKIDLFARWLRQHWPLEMAVKETC